MLGKDSEQNKLQSKKNLPVKEKWSKEKVRQRYVEGDRINLDDLAKLSGWSAPALRDWSRKKRHKGEACLTWPEQRALYWASRDVTDPPDFLATPSSSPVGMPKKETLREVMARHVRMGRNLASLSQVFNKALLTKLASITHPGTVTAQQLEQSNEIIQLFKGLSGKSPLRASIDLMTSSIKIEREALSIQVYTDPDMLEAAARRQGYLLVDYEEIQN